MRLTLTLTPTLTLTSTILELESELEAVEFAVAGSIPGVVVTVAAETMRTCGMPTEAVVFIATEAALTAAIKLVMLLTKFTEDVCAV